MSKIRKTLIKKYNYSANCHWNPIMIKKITFIHLFIIIIIFISPSDLQENIGNVLFGTKVQRLPGPACRTARILLSGPNFLFWFLVFIQQLDGNLELLTKGSFPLRAWNGIFFVSFIVSLLRLALKREKK